ncbi:hypothetical protein PhCBS80983_g03564 [Powellomyces hirtus]|uniref:Cytochrome b5 domain-containing protein 1 n=1 Tax=Powellomyces hirtus TaxID=109895 RepID=A0A507E117_9FUNG|nr:hypothetical protein PhCBS80983_g03564 [Powellomyces hirtus]
MSAGAPEARQAEASIEDRYFTPAEVELHNAPEDCWLSWLGYVYDLRPLIEERKGDPLLGPIVKNAGKDISHWFDKKTGDVASEEKLAAIQERYLAFNSHAKGYMWKRQGQLLDMSRTLEENGLPEERAQFESVGIDEDEWLPAVHLYFSDDLTVA